MLLKFTIFHWMNPFSMWILVDSDVKTRDFNRLNHILYIIAYCFCFMSCPLIWAHWNISHTSFINLQHSKIIYKMCTLQTGNHLCDAWQHNNSLCVCVLFTSAFLSKSCCVRACVMHTHIRMTLSNTIQCCVINELFWLLNGMNK